MPFYVKFLSKKLFSCSDSTVNPCGNPIDPGFGLLFIVFSASLTRSIKNRVIRFFNKAHFGLLLDCAPLGVDEKLIFWTNLAVNTRGIPIVISVVIIVIFDLFYAIDQNRVTRFLIKLILIFYGLCAVLSRGKTVILTNLAVNTRGIPIVISVVIIAFSASFTRSIKNQVTRFLIKLILVFYLIVRCFE